VLLQQQGITQLQQTLQANGFPAYTPNSGNLEIILLGVMATLAADAAQVAAQVPSAIFRAFGTQLLNLPYNSGASATVQSTWTLADTIGHTIPGGSFVTIGSSQLGFYVQSDVVVAAGASSATVPLVAVAQGAAYNGLTGIVTPIDQINWFVSATTIGTSSGGADAETDPAYQNRLATALSLQAPRPITANDYAGMALSVPSTVTPAGVVVGRATSLEGFNPASATFTVSTTSGSPNLAITTSPGPLVTAVAGEAITGTGIPASTTVVSSTTTQIVMSANATATATGIVATVPAAAPPVVGGTLGNQRTDGVFVTDTLGNALSAAAMTSIANWLAGFREVNFVVTVNSPWYQAVYSNITVHVLPGFTASQVTTAVQTAVINYLSPATWGNPQITGATAVPQWINAGFNTVRVNSLVGVVENVTGVQYVTSGGLTLGTSANPVGVVDLVLPGPVPLPTANTSTITVTSA
jgi:hypothetical protein